MIYRQANQSDIPRLIALRLDFLGHLHGPMTEAEKSAFSVIMKEYFHRCLGASVFCYLAEEQDQFISSVFLVLTDRPVSSVTPTGRFGTILNVYTLPQYRHQGHAAALLRMAIADAAALHLSYIELTATPAGEQLYRHLGFIDTPIRNKPMILNL